MFFPKPMKKSNSILHWEKQQKAKIPKKAHCCIFGTCNNVLANEFFVVKQQHLQPGRPAEAGLSTLPVAGPRHLREDL